MSTNREKLTELVRKWRIKTDEADRLFDLPRKRTHARVAYLSADHFARQAMKVIEQELTAQPQSNE